ncbi:IS1634 family transposase [Faecalicatena contorta]|uniref:IS1634 family transposase n=1 Tax=Faecalicatena contorta TaxID=39482 RepID=UPI00129D6CB6|nr:IS1634 family transposase [Faecalicatena contorta]MRM88954.1 IS1634 family transposase [Faecalicatena contorta]
MRLGWSKKGNSISYYVHKTIYINGKNKSQVIKRLGSEKYICETYGVSDAKAWAQEQVELMRQAEKDENPSFDISLNAGTDLVLNEQSCFNGGYLFLQDIYYELGLDKICSAIKTRHNFEYNLNSILSRLLYTRILFPSSKLSAFKDSQRFIEQPNFDLHQIYRALTVLASDSDYIQSRLFKNSMQIASRRTEIIYYDCTNFYFEIEEAEDDKQYGVSKENRPLPIVEMGLFMDRDGIPLAFCINPGNKNEQQSLIPLEKTLMNKFDMSEFIVCTNAGLSSNANRIFNNYSKTDGTRDYITTQSVKKLKKTYQDWTLSPDGWHLCGESNSKKYCLNELNEDNDLEKVFYKSRWIKEKVTVEVDGVSKKVELEQQLIISYSLKYRNYLRTIRNRQVERALKAVASGGKVIEKNKQNDPKRFIKADHATKVGEVADRTAYYIDQDAITAEEMYDGFYAVCTSLDDQPESIVKVNQRRWEIEECFRIMKSEFQARPVYLKRKDRIVAHFITCFIALIIYRYLEKKFDNRFTCSQIIDTLQEMNFIKHEGKGYQPTYTRTELTDALHEAFGFCTSKQIVPIKKMKNICAETKKQDA